MDIDKVKALASETRWKILESLKERRKTVTELARELGLAPSTVYEHLEILERAGLIRKIDEGRKWKYYEPVVAKEKISVKAIVSGLVLVSLLIFGLLFAYTGLLSGTVAPTGRAPKLAENYNQTKALGYNQEVKKMALGIPVEEKGTNKSLEGTGKEAEGQTVSWMPVISVILIILFAVMVIYYWWRGNK